MIKTIRTFQMLESTYNYHVPIRAGHVVYMKWDACRILMGKPEGKSSLEDPDIGGGEY
jgi:hypothetical protein